ncbi:hypothetical protein D3C78_1314050 [compost metagenome]
MTKDQLSKPDTATDLVSAFRNRSVRMNQSAMFIIPPSFKGLIPPDQGYKATGLPYFASGKRINPIDTVSFGISAKSKYPQEAWAFLKELSIIDSPVTQNMVRDNLNNTKSIVEKYSNDSITKTVASEYQYAIPSSRFKNRNYYTIYFTKFNPALRQLIVDASNGENVNVKEELTNIAIQIEDDLKNEHFIPMP